jgi:hypothetical protein
MSLSTSLLGTGGHGGKTGNYQTPLFYAGFPRESNVFH